MNEDFRLLEQVSLFKGIDMAHMSHIIKCLDGKVKKYPRNQLVIRVGDKISSLGVVLVGKVQVIREDIMGNRMIVAGLEVRDVFGETFACAAVEASPVSVLANEACEILWIPIEQIVSTGCLTCSFHSRLISNLLQLLARKNLYLNNKMELLSKRSIKDKIMAYLFSQAEQLKVSSFEIPLNRNELADYLCIDRSALSRELSKLQSEGIIEYWKNHFKIL